ncbi:AAA family ATPase [Methanogenium sp. MK-MG]|uniref:AAA family ATPase n=1 Tax=Methanogenium sp. MK-MG TaxID=2599926 RepID=UPI0013ECD4C8|nr:AAA family ATPase [Methanogenium sp. MK-MG]KAF1075092.1 hypothetical protein MKMG_01802 [Methanogenium sp. MK-MG]
MTVDIPKGMSKIEKISITNYRAIENIQFEPRSVNIIVGPNNCGKSSILESIAILASFDNKVGSNYNQNLINKIINKYTIKIYF